MPVLAIADGVFVPVDADWAHLAEDVVVVFAEAGDDAARVMLR